MFRTLLVLVNGSILAACSYAPDALLSLRFDRQIYIDDVPLSVVVFDTPAGRQQGLMGVSHLAEDQGALFVFEEEQDVVFWMKNTSLSLDMLFFDDNRRLVHIAPSVPPCEKGPCPEIAGKKTKYVIEANAGFARAHGMSMLSVLMFH